MRRFAVTSFPPRTKIVGTTKGNIPCTNTGLGQINNLLPLFEVRLP